MSEASNPPKSSKPPSNPSAKPTSSPRSQQRPDARQGQPRREPRPRLTPEELAAKEAERAFRNPLPPITFPEDLPVSGRRQPHLDLRVPLRRVRADHHQRPRRDPGGRDNARDDREGEDRGHDTRGGRRAGG